MNLFDERKSRYSFCHFSEGEDYPSHCFPSFLTWPEFFWLYHRVVEKLFVEGQVILMHICSQSMIMF